MTQSLTTSSMRALNAAMYPIEESSCPTKIFYVLGIAAVIATVAFGILHFQLGLFPHHTLTADMALGASGGVLLGGTLAILYQWHQSHKVIPLENMLKHSPVAPSPAPNDYPPKLRCATSTVVLIALLVLSAIALLYFLHVWKWTPPDVFQSRIAFELTGVGGILLGFPLYQYLLYPLLKCLNK